MRRHLSWIFAGTLLLGGLAACSDDDDDNGDDPTTTVADSGDDDTTTTEGDSGDASGDPEVQAYCEDVEALAQELEDGGAAAFADLQDELTDLQASGTALATSDLSVEDAEAAADCTERLSEAAASLAGG